MSSEMSEIKDGNFLCDFALEDFAQFRSTSSQLVNIEMGHAIQRASR